MSHNGGQPKRRQQGDDDGLWYMAKCLGLALSLFALTLLVILAFVWLLVQILR